MFVNFCVTHMHSLQYVLHVLMVSSSFFAFFFCLLLSTTYIFSKCRIFIVSSVHDLQVFTYQLLFCTHCISMNF